MKKVVMEIGASETAESCRGRNKTMRWCRKTVVFPLSRVWRCVFSSRVHKTRRDKGEELVKLHNDVQTCGYEDVQVMWEMLRRSDASSYHNKCNQKPPPFWKTILGPKLMR